jgi:Uma2 family endonuclease
MPTQPKIRSTAEEYLALERAAQYKSEFYAGEIFAMAGASEQHNLIVANLVRELSIQQ